MLELLIVGCGPAGLTAGIYAARYGLNTVIIGRDYGLIGGAPLVENYPGFKSITGLELVQKFMENLKDYNLPIKLGEEVSRISREKENFIVETFTGEKIHAYSIIYAAGAKHRKLEIPGEERLFGKGVSYCAVCEAPLYKNKNVAVIGGSYSAAISALILSQHASKVYILYRRSMLRCEPILIQKIAENPKIETVYNVAPVEILGDSRMEAVVLSRPDNSSFQLKIDGVFIEIGTITNVEPVRELGVQLDKDERITVNRDMSTNIKGFFAAGNVTEGSDKLDQIVTAAAEGAIAAYSSYRYLKSRKMEF